MCDKYGAVFTVFEYVDKHTVVYFRTSYREPECHQFDVWMCILDGNNHVFLELICTIDRAKDDHVFLRGPPLERATRVSLAKKHFAVFEGGQ